MSDIKSRTFLEGLGAGVSAARSGCLNSLFFRESDDWVRLNVCSMS